MRTVARNSGDRPLNVALIGTRFMGRAHSNAWLKVGRFFDLPRPVIMHTVCGRDAEATAAFAARWGWAKCSTDWRSIVADPEVDLIDIAAPNNLHAEPAIAALQAGKHACCEKPLAGTLDEARRMVEAAKNARDCRTAVWFNYRRCPAVALAHRLVADGRLGRPYHIRAAYLQEWGGPQTPLLWRFQSDIAGSGAHGDLNAHIIDMARFITGDDIVEVVGAIEETFIKERIPEHGLSARAQHSQRAPRAQGLEAHAPDDGLEGHAPTTLRSTVDDAVLFLARFSGGAVATFEATRLATGNQNRNTIEINGERGALRFNFERMNELEFYDAVEPAETRGWRTIMCTDESHPYAAAWWPAAHVLGYEHGFVNQAADIARVIADQQAGTHVPPVPLPDFADAFQTQRILEAALRSAREKRPVALSEVS